MFVTRVYVELQITSASHRQTQASKLAEKEQSTKKATPLPEHYQRHAHIFSEQEAQRFPGPQLWNHAIELKKDVLATLPGKIYALTQDEQKALQEFIKEQVQKGYICLSKSPYAAPFFFIKKKDGDTLQHRLYTYSDRRTGEPERRRQSGADTNDRESRRISTPKPDLSRNTRNAPNEAPP